MDLSGGSTSPKRSTMTASIPQTARDDLGIESSSHKRSKSGGLLSSLSFLKPREPATRLQKTENDGRVQSEEVEILKGGSSIATALHQSQGRQRKGSLRQAAMAKMRERSGSLRKERATPIITTTISANSADNETSVRPGDYPVKAISSSSTIEHRAAEEGFQTTRGSSHLTAELLESPINGPVGPYASTTDEDDHMSFYRPSPSSSTSSFHSPGQGPAMSLSRRRSNRGEQRIPASAVPTIPEMDLDEEWDYSETEWWGWVVLIATWIVFVVGMGSCLGVWSWAWDVGETPYAPPDLEDDDTLPITGYYPALMVCTAVMAWVWVVVAWVGMKYFRHAKVGVDG